MNKWTAPIVLTLGLLGALNAHAGVSAKPNIVHILTDDLGWQDVAAYYRAVHGKESVYETPHMDRMVKNGMRFMQAYSPSATCAPSRAAYMAGQYPPHTTVLHVMGSMPPRPHNQGSTFIDGHYPMRLDLSRPNIARMLKEAGYLTAHIKKWHIGGRSNGYPAPVDYGFDFSWHGKDKDYNDPDVWDKDMPNKKEYWNGTWLPLNPRHTGFATSDPDDPFRTDPNDDDRPRDGVVDLAVRWLDKAKDSDKPFFLNLCPSLVHGPISTHDRKRLAHYCEKMGVPFPTDSGRITKKEWDKQWGQVNPYYAAMVDGVDWGVGKVLTFLEETDDPRNPGHKLIDNTYLIVSADNGAAEGKFGTKERVADNSPLRRGKSTIYEGGIRVPVIMVGPGIEPGSVSDTPINLIDLFPTFMDMADAEPSEELDLDGCNILPIIKGAASDAKFADGSVRDTIYWTLPVGGTSSSAIRKKGWKLILNHAPEMNGWPGIELFKLYNEDGSPADMSEKENLAETNPEKRDELLADLNAWLTKYEAQLPYKNPAVSPANNTLPGADRIPAVLKQTEQGNKLSVQFETGSGKSRIVEAILVYTTNGSDLLRENPNYEEWFRAPAEVGDGVATAVAPPGMTHGIFALRDENGFLVRSREVPPWHGPTGDSKWTIAKDPTDSFAWRPGLISLIDTGDSARKKAKEGGQDTAALSQAMRTAREILQTPADEKTYAAAMRHLRHEIRVLDVPEAKLSVLNLFKTEKWSSRDPNNVADTGAHAGPPSSSPATAETFTPYKAGEVPQNVTDLWKDYDPRAEDLDVKVIKEWKEEGVTTRYITFKVGTFKGTDARVAAYYCFPDNGKKNPAFVWCHGGGQRADRNNGIYFAKQGFATVDINWLGRELEKDVSENTDWGKVDPTQGPKFYSKALRKGWNRGVKPDEYSIDPVPSPRNNNWFLLVVAAKRGITFLEQQPEVDAERIGLSGFSMGGTITAMTAIDPRVKAAVPFVGGTGFLHVDYPGVPGTSLKVHYPVHLDMYEKTVDPAAYWPLVTCPVMFISSSGDFHSAFDRIYQSMALLPHKAWRVTANMHENHGPGPEQWVLLNKWFNLHLKRIPQRIPVTPPSELTVQGQKATFTVTPENRNNELLETEIYYSYDPNAITRFWIRAEAGRNDAGKSWSAALPVYEKLPLYVFALCRYSLGETVQLKKGSASTLSVNSLIQTVVPEHMDLTELAKLETETVFDDFTKGFQDWAVRSDGQDIRTYKFQSPLIDFSNDNKLSLSINPSGRKLSLRLNADSKFLGHGKDQGSFSLVRTIEGDGPQEVIIGREEFNHKNGKTLEWSKITTFSLSIVDTANGRKIHLTSPESLKTLKRIDMIKAPPAAPAI